MQSLTSEQFAILFACDLKCLEPAVVAHLNSTDTRYRPPNRQEAEEYTLHYVRLLCEDRIERSSSENYAVWKQGWSENLAAVRSFGPSVETLKPRYFRPSKFLRLQKSVVVTENFDLEHEVFIAARHHLFRKYLSDAASVYELGCGSCQNLWMLSSIFPDKKCHGFDWVEPSLELTELLAAAGRKISGSLMNMLQPPEHLNLDPSSAVISIHALEQLGNQHEELIECLIASKPNVVLHYEPIVELYDEGNLYDYLAIWYSRKRGYLNGLLPMLQRLHAERRIELMAVHRPCLGGILHEASVIVWRPV